MKFRTKCIFAVVVFMIVTVVVMMLSYMADRSPVMLLKEESYFDEFHVQGDKVFVDCSLVLRNDSDKDVSVKLRADMTEDKINGLLTSSELYGCDRKGDEEFLVLANSKKEYQVSFVGDFGGKEQKVDRELPPIKVIVVDSKASSENK